MDSSNSKNNIQNKTRCGICEGVGLVKNVNMICDYCSGVKCKFYTGNHRDYAPYEICNKCCSSGYLSDNSDNLDNLIIQENQTTNIKKKSCDKCLGIGYVKREEIICDYCNDPHKMCYCYNFLTPYVECFDCYGSGSK